MFRTKVMKHQEEVTTYQQRQHAKYWEKVTYLLQLISIPVLVQGPEQSSKGRHSKKPYQKFFQTIYFQLRKKSRLKKELAQIQATLGILIMLIYWYFRKQNNQLLGHSTCQHLARIIHYIMYSKLFSSTVFLCECVDALSVYDIAQTYVFYAQHHRG